MSLFNNAITGASGNQGYTIARSVRTRASASGNFTRTLSTPTDSTKFTFSAWIKRGSLSSSQGIFQAGNTNYIQFGSGDTIQLVLSNTAQLTTTAVFRDPSAWGHLVFSYNNAASPKWNFYYNNANIGTSTASNTTLNTATAHGIANPPSGGGYFDGYLTEINFIDGQALTPSSFGETDSITGVWKAKKYSGTYGTNGFYLNFSDNSSNTATTIGKDYSGNGNNWTPNNISVTAGVTYDSMVDSPTVSAVSSNYCVVNPLDKGGGVTITDGNLTLTRASSLLDWDTARCTIQVPSTGKYYWELTLVSGSNDGCLVGVGTATADLSQEVNGFWAYQSAGYIIYNGSYTTATALSVGDVVMIAFDRTNNKLWFGRNGTWGLNGGTPVTPTDPNSNFTSLPSDLFPAVGIRYTANSAINFGQRPFTYTPPTGFVALNTYNLPASTIKNGAAYMAATTYTGTGSTQSITNTVGSTSFQPDFVWIKSRSNAENHNIVDSIRGAGVWLASNLTQAETNDTGSYGVSTFNSNGFTVISNGTRTNASGYTYIGWQWKAGGTSSSNTNGSITSTVSANTTAGFSVVTYTGTGANATVGHGLGVAPSMIIVKDRSVSNWNVYHTSLGNTQAVLLNSTNATSTSAGYWNNTSPTSTVFSVGNGTSFTSGLAYCFAAVAGYSAFGSYTANASADGPFIYTGFRPRWIMLKRSSAASAPWSMIDTSRSSFNAAKAELDANVSDAETTAGNGMDILSNGFKLRDSGYFNSASGATFIYAAFAENPFKNALAR